MITGIVLSALLLGFRATQRAVGPLGTQLSANVDGQIVGAFIVDPAEGRVDDRVFVLTRWVKRNAA